jgi:hypothetical protein
VAVVVVEAFGRLVVLLLLLVLLFLLLLVFCLSLSSLFVLRTVCPQLTMSC